MPTPATAISNDQRVREYLKSNPVGVLATVDADNNPHASVIYYSVDNDFNFFKIRHNLIISNNMA